MNKQPRSNIDRLRLRLEGPATPAAVAAMATALGDALRAMVAELAPEAVTLVVDNFLASATVRARTKDGREAADRLMAFVENPVKAASKCHNPQAAAAALAA